MTLITESQAWRDRAEEMRILSGLMHEYETTEIMLRLADGYDRQAMLAEKREAMLAEKRETEERKKHVDG